MHSVRDAVILAAGMGSRMNVGGAETRIFKPFIRVGERTIVERNLAILKGAGIERVVVVLGYEADHVRGLFEALPPWGGAFQFVVNPEWKKSNGLSLLATKGLTRGPFVLIMGDHLFDADLLGGLLAADHGDWGVVLGVDRKIAQVFDLDDATKVVTDPADPTRIVTIGKELATYDAVDVGVFLCSQDAYGALEAAKKASPKDDCSLSEGWRVLAKDGRFRAHDVGAARWQDVDTPEMMGNAVAWFGR
jgi:choline kinase